MVDFIIENGVLIKYNGKKSHVVIPDGVTSIGEVAFHSHTNLKSVEIPNTVTSIGDNAFSDCRHLTNIKIPNSVTSFGIGAFFMCTDLKSIEIPSSVININKYAFSGCTSLTNIKIPNGISYIGFCTFDTKKVKPQYKQNGSLRAFKAFFHDWTCKNDFQYKVGESYHQDGKIVCCHNGFHACPNPLDIFDNYYGNLSKLHFAEVELYGKIERAFGVTASSDIKIIRELTISELAEIYNSMEKV